jgi:hypothetical protein
MPIGNLFAFDQYTSIYESAENRFSQMDTACSSDAAELGGMFHDWLTGESRNLHFQSIPSRHRAICGEMQIDTTGGINSETWH